MYAGRCIAVRIFLAMSSVLMRAMRRSGALHFVHRISIPNTLAKAQTTGYISIGAWACLARQGPMEAWREQARLRCAKLRVKKGPQNIGWYAAAEEEPGPRAAR